MYLTVPQLQTLLEENIKGNITGNITLDSYTITGYSSRRRLLATSSVAGSLFSGIQNPTTCLEYGQVMLFSVTNTHYPIYDVWVEPWALLVIINISKRNFCVHCIFKFVFLLLQGVYYCSNQWDHKHNSIFLMTKKIAVDFVVKCLPWDVQGLSS